MVWVEAEYKYYERWTDSKESQTVMAFHRLFLSSSDHSSLSFSHVESSRGEAVWSYLSKDQMIVLIAI